MQECGSSVPFFEQASPYQLRIIHLRPYNLYCDESCHLENDRSPVMVLGVVSCPVNRAGRIARDLREVKTRHGMGHGKPWNFETKWSKVSASGLAFYRDYLDYFFDSPDLSFRSLIVSNKRKLRHEDFQQSHDEWYYKMFYQALKPLISAENTYSIYLDRKDTLSQYKVEHLRTVLSNQLHDFRQEIITRVQQVRSDEVEQVQLVDLLIGAVGYHNRRLRGNAGKEALVRHVQHRSGLTLGSTTAKNREKVNLFVWDAQEGRNG